MVTAGVTALALGASASGTARAGGTWHPASSRAQRSRWTRRFRRTQRTPAAPNPAAGLTFRLPRPRRAAQELTAAPPPPPRSPRRSLTCPTCSARRVGKERGASQPLPLPRPGAKKAMIPTPHPRRSARGGGEAACAHAPVLRARFRQWQLISPSRCHLVPASPRPVPPAAAQQRLLTAPARAAGRGRRRRRAGRAHLLRGLNGLSPARCAGSAGGLPGPQGRAPP